MTVTINGTSGIIGAINSMTAVNSTSGTSIDFTGIPSGVKRVTVLLNGVSTNAAGASPLQTQIGAGSITSTGYVSYAGAYNGSSQSAASTSTTGFVTSTPTGNPSTFYGTVIIQNLSGNTWVATISGSGLAGDSTVIGSRGGAGSVTLGSTLDRVRITTVNGTDTFDAGSINVFYE